PLVWHMYPKQDLTIHIGNSGASIQHTEDMTAYSRVGVSIYDMYPSHDLKQTAPVKLKPALQLKSEIIHVKQARSEEHTSELQSRFDLVCRLLLEKKKMKKTMNINRQEIKILTIC